MSGLSRNFKYWAWTLEKILLNLVLSMLGYSLIMSFLSKEDFFKASMGYILFCLCMVTFMLPIVYGISSIAYFYQSVAMGSSRKNSFIAMQVMQHLILAEILVVFSLLYPFAESAIVEIEMVGDADSLKKMVLSAMIAVALLMQVLSNLTSTICLRYGNGISIVVYLVTFFAVGLVIMTVLLTSNDITWLYELLAKSYLYIGAIVADLLTIWLYYIFAKKADLRLA